MSLIRPIETETETASEDAFELTEKLLLRTASVMNDLAERLEAGDVPSETDIRKTMAALTQSAGNFMKERDRILEHRRKQTGAVTGDAFDLDAARDEIRCKLDHLREHGAARGVS